MLAGLSPVCVWERALCAGRGLGRGWGPSQEGKGREVLTAQGSHPDVGEACGEPGAPTHPLPCRGTCSVQRVFIELLLGTGEVWGEAQEDTGAAARGWGRRGPRSGAARPWRALPQAGSGQGAVLCWAGPGTPASSRGALEPIRKPLTLQCSWETTPAGEARAGAACWAAPGHPTSEAS